MKKALIFSFLWGTLFANPANPQVVSGEVYFNSQGRALEVIASDRAIIEWGLFNIQEEETTRFIQPNRLASVLNRVLDANPSKILGRLESNGQVVLINPNGILVGMRGVIDTGSLIASTLDLQNSSYLSRGSMVFDRPSKRPIVQMGDIIGRKGDVILIAHSVENEGEIRAVDGIAALVAGGSVVKTAPGNGEMSRLFVSQGAVYKPFEERGFLEGFEREVLAVPFYTKEGILPRVAHKLGGVISSVRSDGFGGEVSLIGTDVWVLNSAQVDASGAKGGGIVRVGGGFGAAEPGILNSQKVFLGPNAQIKADGNGGKVVLYGTCVNQFLGSISARGERGFIEVAGAMHFFPQGTVDAETIRIDYSKASAIPSVEGLLKPFYTVPPFVPPVQLPEPVLLR